MRQDMARMYDIRITTSNEGTEKEIPLVVMDDWDDLKNLLYSLLILPLETDFISVIITPLETEDKE
jgi:hypothetical protein